MGQNRAKSIGIFEMGSDKWIFVFNQAYILILSNQICKHYGQNFPPAGHITLNDQSSYVLVGVKGQIYWFFIRKILKIIRKILRIIFRFFTNKNFGAGK